MFINAFNELLCERWEIISNIELMRSTLFDTSELRKERERLKDEMKLLIEMTQSCIAENARIALNQEEYQRMYNMRVEKYDRAKERFEEISYDIKQREARGEEMSMFINALKSQENIITEFNETLLGSMVEYITIGKDTRSVTFKDGTAITL